MEISQIYDQFVADHFDEDQFKIYEDARKIALAQIEGHLTHPNPRVLDLGMGTGEWLSKLTERFPQAQLTAVELSQKMIQIARHKLSQRNLSIEIFHKDVNEFTSKLCGHPIDLMSIHFVLNYVDRKRLIPEAYQTLDSGGLFSVASSTHGSFPFLHELAKNFLSTEQIKAQYLIPEDLEELEGDLTSVGFEIVERRLFRKPLTFTDFNHFYHFAMHSGWLADPVFLKHMTQGDLDTYREFGKSLFPLSDHFESVIVLAKKP